MRSLKGHSFQAGIWLFIVLLSIPAVVRAEDGLRQPRTILALYDSSELYSPLPDDNLIHKKAAVVLNYLGMKVRYHDLAQGLPGDGEMEDVCGVLTWFKDDSVPSARDYCRWADRQMRSGKRYVILGNFGAYRDAKTGAKTPQEDVFRLFEGLGLEYLGNWTDNPLVIRVVEKDSAMVEFERTLSGEVGEYEGVVSASRGNKAYLVIERTDIADGKSTVVVTAPNGGFVLEEYELFINNADNRSAWRIEPFLFFEEAFGLKGIPRYDTTTLFGKRIFYSHIDGDGFRNVSDIDPKRIAGEIIRDEILKKYGLPITASFIAAEIDPAYLGSEKMVSIAREILSLENVEVGVHGFSHPLDWDRQLTVFEIRGYSRPLTGTKDPDILSESPYGRASLITVPRAEFLRREIVDATEYTNRVLAPKGKKVAVYQWTGNCRPPADAIALTEGLGIRNINGGDSRFDAAYPSYTGLAPLTRSCGGRYQVYASNANENIYTNGWTGPFYGYEYVRETFRQTETPTLVRAPPRRVKPINVYYHYFSGEKAVSLKAVKDAYDYALAQDIIPVRTSEYAALVDGFLSGKVRATGDGGWEFSGYGNCRTVRFDSEGMVPDLSRSAGILGFTTWNGCLYVHLTESGRAVLYCAKDPPRSPYLKEASSVLTDVSISDGSISFSTRTYRETTYQFAGLPPGNRYEARVKSARTDAVLFTRAFVSDQKGGLTVRVPSKGDIRVVITRIR